MPIPNEDRPLPYDADYYDWLHAQAACCRQERPEALDLERLGPVLEEFALQYYDEVRRHLIKLLAAILTWTYSPAHRGPSGQRQTYRARDVMTRTLKRSPSLRQPLADLLPGTYRAARRKASLDSGLPPATFPEGCPWSLADVLDEDYWPVPTATAPALLNAHRRCRRS